MIINPTYTLHYIIKLYFKVKIFHLIVNGIMELITFLKYIKRVKYS